MPCVDEVCVGDDALSLMHLPWQRATGPGTDTPLADARVSASYLDDVHSVLRGDEEAIRRIAPYWYLRVLDADGLRALTGIRAVCESPGVDGRLHGVYVDEQGHRTVVSFEPVASFAGARPRFLVAAIVRYFSADDPVHLKVVAKEVADRYRGLPAYATATEPAAAWISVAASGPHLRLLAPAGDPVERDANLRRHAECEENRADIDMPRDLP
jgi:hypothetical protein